MQIYTLFIEQMQHLFLKSWWVAFNALRWIKNNINILTDGNTQMTDKLCKNCPTGTERDGKVYLNLGYLLSE